MDKALVRRVVEVGAEPIYLGTAENDLDREIAENCWLIGASDEERNEVTAAELARALDVVIECRRAQVVAFTGKQNAIFYAWTDAQAGQLRCCMISAIHPRLPFGRGIAYVSSALPVMEEFLASSDCVPWSDLVDVPWTDPSDDVPCEEPLNVYAVHLP